MTRVNEIQNPTTQECKEGIKPFDKAVGSKYLTQVSDHVFQNLSELKLGYNMLGDGCALPLSTLLRHLHRLESLALQSTEITQRFFQQHRVVLSQALQGRQFNLIITE